MTWPLTCMDEPPADKSSEWVEANVSHAWDTSVHTYDDMGLCNVRQCGWCGHAQRKPYGSTQPWSNV